MRKSLQNVAPIAAGGRAFMTQRRWLVGVLAIVAAASACGDDDSGPSADEDASRPDASTLVDASADARVQADMDAAENGRDDATVPTDASVPADSSAADAAADAGLDASQSIYVKDSDNDTIPDVADKCPLFDDTTCVHGSCATGTCVCEANWAGTTCATQVSVGSTCRTVQQGNVTATSGVYSIDPDGSGGQPPFTAYCNMGLAQGGWTLVRRTSASSGAHYPGNDNALGTDARGTYQPDPMADAVFSLAYSTWDYTQLLFTTGDQTKWMVIDRGFLKLNYDCASSPATIVKSHISETPYTVIGCSRDNGTGYPEQPWLTVRDHNWNGIIYTTENESHSMLYGENGIPLWIVWLVNHGGLDVYVR
jgi:hypothetical protein